ncbi:hypothetical protein [Dongia sp.]
MRITPLALILVLLMTLVVEGCTGKPGKRYHRHHGGAGEHR